MSSKLCFDEREPKITAGVFMTLRWIAVVGAEGMRLSIQNYA